MRSQTLAISVVLLLIAVATIPGISFSLSSSVTSYNNEITMIDDEPRAGLYKSPGFVSEWTTPAFGEGIISVNKTNSNITVEENRINLSGSHDVYLCVSGIGSFSLTIGATCSDQSQVKIVERIQITISSSSTTYSKSLAWDSLVGGVTFDNIGPSDYKVTMELITKAGTYPLNTDRMFSLDIFFKIDSDNAPPMIWNKNNSVGSSDDVKGIIVDSSNHTVVPIDNPTEEMKKLGDVYSISKKDGHFASGKTYSKAEIVSDKSNSFLICLNIDNQNTPVTVKITAKYVDENGVTQTLSYNHTFDKEGNGYKYIGILNSKIDSNNGSKGNLSSFTDMDVTINISADPQGNTNVDLFLIITNSNTSTTNGQQSA